MKLIRDLMFKRNIHGYMEYSRIQLYSTHLRQIPMYVVYLVHNDETGLLDASEYGSWFIGKENAARFVKTVIEAWIKGEEAIPSIDLTPELIESLRKPPVYGDEMYRVVFRDPFGDIPGAAIGSMPHNQDLPWFVSEFATEAARHNIYKVGVATTVARLNATMPNDRYVGDRVRNSRAGAYFAVERAPYHPSGIPQGVDQWHEVDAFPVWNRTVGSDFTEDAMDVQYKHY